jgi:dimeric dUTPase (all-alpha-NTP-PPase superfamily)
VSKLNPENKCSQLYDEEVPKLKNPLVDLFKMQLSLQKRLAQTGRGVDYDVADFKTRVDDITIQWRNLTTEFAELIERLPFKEWKTYTPEQLRGARDQETTLEIWYEYADMFHFFMNIGLALGIRGDDLEKLYVTKNKENFRRQDSGY